MTAASTLLVPAARYFERAVTLDPEFLTAWVRLAQTQAVILGNRPSEASRAGISRATARRAAERAAALAGSGPDGHLALGFYYGLVEQNDPRALEQFRLGLRASPNNADLLIAASLAEQTLGRWDDALAHNTQASLVDPRSTGVLVALGHVLLQMRRYGEATQVFARARAVKPNDANVLEGSVMMELALGDLAAARAVMANSGTPSDSAAALAAALASRNLVWALDARLRDVLERLTPAAFGGDRITWGIALADAAIIRGDTARARAYADSARAEADVALQRAPNDAYIHAAHGLTLARLGHREAAIREGKRAVQLVPTVRYAADGPYLQHQLVRVYLLVGDYDNALDQLEPLLKTPYYLSPEWLRIDPTFAPLRGHPRFDKLARGG